MKAFVYSVIGLDENDEMVNTFGTVTGPIQEYARRGIVQNHRKFFPKGTILNAYIAELDPAGIAALVQVVSQKEGA